MKKKYLLISLLFFGLLLVGCGSEGWKSNVELSELKFNDKYIVGKVKNKTEKYYDVVLKLELKNGDLTEDDNCYFKLKPNETKDIRCIEADFDDSYSVTIKNVELTELQIPKQDESNADSLEYYFDDVYESHSLNMTSLAYDKTEGSSYPYIDGYEYYPETNEISIHYKYKLDGSTITTGEFFNSVTQKMTSFYLSIYDCNDDILSKIKTRIILMPSVYDQNNSTSMLRALGRTDIETGKCLIVGNWCISTTYSDDSVSFFFEKR